MEKSSALNILWRKRVTNRRPRRKITILIAAVVKPDLLKRRIVAVDIIAIVGNVGEKLNHRSQNNVESSFANVFSFLCFPLNGF